MLKQSIDWRLGKWNFNARTICCKGKPEKGEKQNGAWNSTS